LLNQKEVLDALAKHKERDRFVPEAVDRGEEFAIKPFATGMLYKKRINPLLIQHPCSGKLSVNSVSHIKT